ncbi:uncharacterized protein DS421_16g544710 [Arachis hypogaea]|nr:uncharacterized protein DS421_16g544710 [Arachis hypogaea]
MVETQADDVFFMFSLKISCSITTGSKKTRKSAFGSLFLVQFLAAAKEARFVFDGSEVVVVAAGKHGFLAIKFMIFDVFLMCI